MSTKVTLPLAAAITALTLPAFANGILPTPSPVAAPTDWSGAYIGGSLAHGSFHGTACNQGLAGGTCDDGIDTSIFPDFPMPEPSGAMFGITAGYDWQMGNIVYGIAGDLMFGDLVDAALNTPSYNCGIPGQCQLSVSGVAILRGRLGYAVSDRLLPYVTAGVAMTQVNVELGSLPDVDDTATNLVVGLGADYMATDMISVGFDFLHLVERAQNLGSGSTNFGMTDFGGNILRLNVAYRF